jgi:fructan beta-fructosidase
MPRAEAIMKHRPWKWCAAVVVATLATVPVRAAEPASGPYDEPHRPQFHFSPARNWMNDPNGLVWADGEWHLFYQYNPEGDTWGHMSWGHAVSPDLVRWQHLPVALREEAGIMIFSGSAVLDDRNTSGFGKDGQPPLVAIYTGHEKNRQTQHIAHSTDRGRTWTKFAGNPVLDENLKDFRDPKVLWHEPTKRWVMVVAVPDRHKVWFYGSPDLKTWERLGEFGGQGATNGIWECPDLFELPVERDDGTPAGESRWVLVVNINGGTPAGGSGCQYFVGQFDGRTFTNDHPEETALWADWGADFYAAVSWSNGPPADARKNWVGWMSNWRYANQEPTKPWRTAQSVPRTLTLRQTRDGVHLVQRPVKELEQLRTAHKTIGPVNLRPGEEPLDVKGDTLELVATFQNVSAGEFGLKLRTGGGGEETLVGYEPASLKVFVDRRHSGEMVHKDFPARHAARAEPDGQGRVTFHILLDRSSVELFAHRGESVITDRIFPDPQHQGVSAYAAGGDATLVSLEVWTLNLAWNAPKD